MSSDIDILSIIYSAIDEINEQLPADNKITKTPETLLFDRKGALDSLGLVNLIVAVEQKLEDSCRKAISLSDDMAMSQDANPFVSVQALHDYIVGLLG